MHLRLIIPVTNHQFDSSEQATTLLGAQLSTRILNLITRTEPPLWKNIQGILKKCIRRKGYRLYMRKI